MLTRYRNYLEIYDRSSATIKSYLDTAEKYLFYLKTNNKPLRDTTSADIINFFTDCCLALSAKSKNQKLAALKNFYKFLLIDNYLSIDPTVTVPRFKEPVREPQALNEQEIIDILSAAQGTRNSIRNKAIITTILICCLRCSEAANLNLSDFKNNTIHVIGKGNKERYIPYSDTVREVLEEYLSGRPQTSSNALFLSERTHERISVRSIQNLMETISKQTGIDFHAHTLRHTGATYVYQATGDIVSVQEILGHSNLNTTRHYIHLPNTAKQQAISASSLNNLLLEK